MKSVKKCTCEQSSTRILVASKQQEKDLYAQLKEELLKNTKSGKNEWKTVFCRRAEPNAQVMLGKK
jgi:hypothetical protein